MNYLKQLNETISCSDELSAKREAGVSPARLPSLYGRSAAKKPLAFCSKTLGRIVV